MGAERILAKLRGEPWAIQPDWLGKMIHIAERMNDAEMLEAKAGPPLESTYNATTRDGTAIIPIEGPIFPKANLMTEVSGATALSLVARDFQTALEDESVNNIVLRINSPGGQSTGIDEMASMIRAADKPVLAHVSGVGASAAYWIASATDKISISPTSSVGSIGVAYTTRAESDGESDIIEFVSSLSPKKRLSPNSDEGKEQIMTLIDGMAEVFISDVALGRGTSSEDVQENYGQGGMVLAPDAVKIGMADHVGTFEELMAELSGHSTSSYGDKQMNIIELKAKHPEVYQAIIQEGVTSAEEAHQVVVATMQSENTELTQQNEDLVVQVSQGEAEVASLLNQVQTLEKNETIRAGKAISDKAESMVSTSLAESNIPKHLHIKVSALLDHTVCIDEEGVFDESAYQEKINAEIKEWSEGLQVKSPLAGNLGDGGTEADNGDNNTTAVDENVERLLKHVK